LARDLKHNKETTVTRSKTPVWPGANTGYGAE
jgi:hypothetical protein